MSKDRIQRILKSVDAKVGTLIKPDCFYVALYDELRSKFEFPWVVEKGEHKNWDDRAFDEKKAPDWLVKQKTPCLLEQDIPEQNVARQMIDLGVVYWPDGEIPKSWLGVPILFEGRVLGVLVVESHTRGVFGERGKRILSTIAGQTAGAIETARLYERLNRKIKNLDAVNEIGQKLNSQIQLRETEILKLIHEEASKLIHTDNMYIALFDETRDEIRFPLMFVGGKVHKVPVRKFEHDDMGKTEKIIKTKEPLFHATKKKSEDWYGQIGHKEHIGKTFGSWIGVPMIVRDKVIGVIAAYHDTLDYVYDETDLQILSSMANQAAIALDNARLYDHLDDLVFERTRQLEERTKQLEAIQDIGVKITSQLDLDDVLGSIAEHANRLMAADFTTLFPWNSNLGTFEKGIRRGNVQEEPTLPTPDSYVYSIATEQECIFFDAKDNDRQFPDVFIGGQKSQAFACIPMIVGEKTIGVLLVNYFEPHYFSAQKKELLVLLGNQAAVAIENANLYTKMNHELQISREKISHAEEEIIINGFTMDILHRVPNFVGSIPVRAGTIIKRLRKKDILSDIDEITISQIEGIKKDAESLLTSVKKWNPLEEARRKVFEDVGMLLNSALRNTYVPDDVIIEANIDKKIPKILCNPKELFEAFRCIIENGIQAMPNGGNLSVIAKVHGENTVIKIADNGVGILPSDLNKVFDLGFTTKQMGSGYGLWRAKAVIEKIGGKIEVSSEYKKGTTFTIKQLGLKGDN